VLVADLGAGVTDESDVVARAVAYGEGEPIAGDHRARDRAARAILTWGERRGAARDINGVRERHVARRIAGIVSRTRAHRRPAVAELAARARQAAVLPLSAGAVRALGALAQAEMEDEVWLAAMAEFADAHRGAPRRSPPGVEILAMLLFDR
jgi:hypothetical protein